MAKIPFIGRPYLVQSPLVDANIYVDMDVETKEQTLYNRPGLTLWLDTGVQAEVRNIFSLGTYLYAVVGPNVFKIDVFGNITLLGQLNTSTGHVWIEANSHQTMIVDGTFGYLIDVEQTLIPVNSWFLWNNIGLTPTQPAGVSSAAGYITASYLGEGRLPFLFQEVTCVITNAGSGYTSGNVTVSAAGSGVGITFTPVILNGEIIAVSVWGAGSYYVNGAPLNFTVTNSSSPSTPNLTNLNTNVYQTLITGAAPTLVFDQDNDYTLLQNDSVSLLQAGQYFYDSSTGNLYVWTSTGNAPNNILIDQPLVGAFTQMTDPDFLGGGSLCYMDTFFIVHNGTEFAICNANDGTNWNALNFATKEGYSDSIVTTFSDHEEVWLFGQKTTEVWYDTGAAFALGKVPSGYLETGCGAAASPAKCDEGIFWFTNKGQVVRAVQYSPQVVSSRRMEWNIAQYERTDDARGWACFYQGRAQYYLSFPSAGVTWVYEPATQKWHRRTSRGATGNYRANCCCQFAGQWLVGDYENGLIYQLDANNYQDNDQPIERIWTLPSIEDKGKRVFHSKLELIIDAGVGDPQNDLPQIALSWSDDGEKTWGNEVWRSPGRIGNYLNKIIYDRLGNSYKRSYRIAQSDNCPTVIRDVQLNEGL